MTTSSSAHQQAAIQRLQAAMNEHDLEAFLACFDPEYRSEQPAHPDRAFGGVEQVRKNWSKIFGGIPDFRAELLRHTVDGDTHWAEWRWFGTQPDGVRMELRGVTLFGVEQDRIAWGRLYMEPVKEQGAGIDEAVDEMTASARASSHPQEKGARS
ncbi:hypothetical protein BH23GEM7_BH23GEM7_20470 [soil metagenome]